MAEYTFHVYIACGARTKKVAPHFQSSHIFAVFAWHKVGIEALGIRLLGAPNSGACWKLGVAVMLRNIAL